MFRLISLFVLLTFASAAAAEDTVSTQIGQDAYAGGDEVRVDAEGIQDVFAAGGTVTVAAPASGSVHAAGWRIAVTAPVGGDLYAAGMDIGVSAAIGGDASVMGYDVVLQSIGGNLRAGGATIRLAGPVAGYAVVGGEDVTIDAPVGGDLHLAADDVDWGAGARVDGRVIVYEEDPGDLDVPESVAPADRIERREITEWEEVTEHAPRPGFGGIVSGYLTGVLVVALLAAAIAALMPEALAGMRRRILDAPVRTLWIGFLAQSALIGAGLLFAMSLIGLFFTPAAILLAGLTGFAGYVIGAYAFGVWLVMTAGRGAPSDISDRAVAALLGAALAGIIAFIPLLGWLFVLALMLSGVGAITIRLFSPRFMTH